MREAIHPSGRLIKVLLPAHLVGAMDEVISTLGPYANRSEFIADAIGGHLAELYSEGAADASSGLQLSMRTGAEATDTDPRSTESRPLATALPSLPKDTPTLEPVGSREAEPTWGMHNRDFPTLWALVHLGRATYAHGEPVSFGDWLPRVVADAWDLGRRLPTDKFDVSGFPTNPTKREASEGRFIKFFIGEGPGSGPLFDLGLAGTAGQDRVAPTAAGLALLKEVEGFSCERGRGIPREWAASYLRHLAQHAPADMLFVAEILNHIRSGHDDRTKLVNATANMHPDWSDSVVDTNVAGFVARAREWGLLLPRQRKGRYVLEDEAMTVLEEVGKA